MQWQPNISSFGGDIGLHSSMELEVGMAAQRREEILLSKLEDARIPISKALTAKDLLIGVCLSE